nr:transposon Ty3-G Gag-Pol polyprotein [Tanacetum cinerariifolium]
MMLGKTPPAIESAAADYSEPQAEVFFHAITCTIHPQMLRLPGKIKNKDVVVLIDGECDASGVGIGAILTQQGHPITYYSAPLKGSMLAWSTYEKEMLAIVRAIRKWRSYLLGRPFVVKTEHISLNELVGRVATGSKAGYYHNLPGCFPTKIPQDFGLGKGEFLVVWDQRRGEKEDISMDLIEGLPTSNEFTTIMADWLSWAEFSYNTSIHSATKMTPFEVLYGRPPPRVLTYVLGASKVQAIEEFLINQDKFLRDLRSNLLLARDRMKSKADSKKQEVEFSVGDMVYLKLQPYMQSTVAVRLSAKLELPPEALIHNVFHVSLLKRCKGDPPIPVSSEAGLTVLPLIGPPPEAVLEERVVKKGKYRPKTEVLVK